MVFEPETMLDIEVAVLIEREMSGDVGDDWASTVARKANPRRKAARKSGWRRPTMAMVVVDERLPRTMWPRGR